MKNVRRNILCNALIIAIGVAGAVSNAQAQEAGETKNFDVPAQSAASALNAFAEQADITLVFSKEDVSAVSIKSLSGSFPVNQGIAKMLEGTGLSWQMVGDKSIVIRRSNASEVSGAGNNSPVQLKEVTVTAEKKVNTAQKTPITMSVMDAESLRHNDISNMVDLGAYAPSVSIATSGANTIVGIRGVSSRDTGELGDPAVSIAVDGFTLQSLTGINMTMFDLERVEILRGPQGTLAGRNATAGAINIITAKPEDIYSGAVAVELGNYGAHNTNAHVNLPINPIAKLRIAMQTRDHDGYRDNAPAEDGDDEHSKAARAILQVDPSDHWTMLLTGEYSKSDGVGGVIQGVSQNYNTDGTVVTDQRPDIPGDGKSFYASAGGHTNIYNRMLRFSTTYDMDWASLTYQGGYRSYSVDRLFYLGGAEGTNRENIGYWMQQNPASTNHEIRLVSSQDSRLGWQIGGYSFEEKQDLYNRNQSYDGNLYGDATDIQIYDYDVRSKARALFGQVSIPVGKDVTLEAGFRRSFDEKTRGGTQTTTNLATWLNSGTTSYSTTSLDQEYSSNKNTYHVAGSWQLTPDRMLYAKFDTGYKAGGFSDAYSYGPETVYSYEIGSKNRFLDRTLELNVSAYYYNYRDQQVTQLVTDASGLQVSVITNAGRSEYKGLEVEGAWLFSDADKLTFYTAYSDAEYTDFETARGGMNVQLAGNRPPQSPEWSVNLGWQHDWFLEHGTLSFKAQSHYETETHFTIYNYTADQQKSYHRSDLSLGYYPSSYKWSVEGYVRNLEDNRIIANAQDPSSTSYFAYRYQWMPPRTFGVKYTLNW